VAAALVFLGLAVSRDWAQLRAYDWHVRPATTLLSIVALVAVLSFGVAVWGRTLACFGGTRIGYRGLFRIWFLSSLARYIPGKIWQFVGAARLAKDYDVPAPVLFTSLIVNMGFTLLAAVVVGLAVLPDALSWLPPAAAPWVLAAAVVVSLAGVHPAVMNFGLRLIPHWVHRTVLVWTGSWLDGIGLVALAAVNWLLYGGALLLFVSSLIQRTPTSLYLGITGANALAFVAGYVILIAPAGLGAREISMTALLAPLLTSGVAAIVAVASRLWIVAAELSGAGVALWLGRRASARAAQNSAHQE
jgi:glycosyltransferase 2 family protein